MISPAQQLRDEQLTAAGHDPECAAYRDEDCDCVPDNAGADRPPGRPAAASAGAIMLAGAAAAAYREYQAAAKELKAATELHQRAQQRFAKAHQAFADAAVDA